MMSGYYFRKINLQRDTDTLFHMMMARDQYLFSMELPINSDYQFADWFNQRLHSDFHDFYLYVREKDQKIIGYAHNYGFSVQDGHCKITVYVLPEFRDSGVGMLCAIRFIDLLFCKYPLRKIYMEVYAYNKNSLANNEKSGAVKEGILKDYRYYNGAYHDLNIFSIDRAAFYKRFGGFLRR